MSDPDLVRFFEGVDMVRLKGHQVRGTGACELVQAPMPAAGVDKTAWLAYLAIS